MRLLSNIETASAKLLNVVLAGQPDLAGRLNEPGWVAADIDFVALERVRTGGEMRNAADWSLQPGARPLAGEVEVASLV